MRLYKYVAPERVDVVRDLRIRFTPPGYLSDPFECRIAYPPPSSGDATHSPTGSGIEEDEYIRLWRRMASFEWGILCLTKRPDNLVMWAHYAAAHRGFLLEFDPENAFFKKRSVWHFDLTWMDQRPLVCPGFGNLREVQYTEQRPSTSNPNEVPLSSFFMKSPDWAYEEEVRMILPLADADFKSEEGDIHLFRFPPDALTGVILGAGAEKKLSEGLSTLIGSGELAHAKLLRAKLSLRTFGMEFGEA